MAIAKKLEDEISRSSSRSSSSILNEALLIDSAMCIIGLQVHVHIKDGSIFSGIFYTISLENEFSTFPLRFYGFFFLIHRQNLVFELIRIGGVNLILNVIIQFRLIHFPMFRFGNYVLEFLTILGLFLY